MKETLDFFMPDYYPYFACKMGNCRFACCEGWPISISMKNYFSLLGLECPKPLRDRLDCGLRVCDHPTKEEYARFEPRYDGNCPMRMTDGRCSLHAQLGDDVLPDVCRLYPRGIRVEDGVYECSCANSCEAVLETFLNRQSPISFGVQKQTVQLPPLAPRRSYFETLGMEQKVRMYLISVIQNRQLTLPQRIIQLGDVLDEIDNAVTTKDKDLLDRIVDLPITGETDTQSVESVDSKHLGFGLRIVEQMIEILDAGSQSIRACGEAALSYFNNGDDPLERYYTAKGHFEALFPQWELFYEHMLVNHMFFSQFPFQDRPESMHSEYVALCALYAIMRFLGLGCMAERREETCLIDGMSACFRLVDHTEFDRYASHLLKRLSCTSSEQLLGLMSL